MKTIFHYFMCTSLVMALSLCTIPAQATSDSIQKEQVRSASNAPQQKVNAEDKTTNPNEENAQKKETAQQVESKNNTVFNSSTASEQPEVVAEKESTNFLLIMAFVFALLAAAWSLFVWMKFNELKKEWRKITHSSKTEKIKQLEERVKQLEKKVNALNAGNKAVAQKQNKSAEQPTSVQKTTTNNISSEKSKTTPQKQQVDAQQPVKPIQPVYDKKGYVKEFSDNFFMKVLPTNEEGCVFKLNYQNDKEAEFDIISLDKIKSRNRLQGFIECSGCSLEDAKHYDCIAKGKCRLADENKDAWQVTERLKIKLS